MTSAYLNTVIRELLDRKQLYKEVIVGRKKYYNRIGNHQFKMYDDVEGNFLYNIQSLEADTELYKEYTQIHTHEYNRLISLISRLDKLLQKISTQERIPKHSSAFRVDLLTKLSREFIPDLITELSKINQISPSTTSDTILFFLNKKQSAQKLLWTGDIGNLFTFIKKLKDEGVLKGYNHKVISSKVELYYNPAYDWSKFHNLKATKLASTIIRIASDFANKLR